MKNEIKLFKRIYDARLHHYGGLPLQAKMEAVKASDISLWLINKLISFDEPWKEIKIKSSDLAKIQEYNKIFISYYVSQRTEKEHEKKDGIDDLEIEKSYHQGDYEDEIMNFQKSKHEKCNSNPDADKTKNPLTAPDQCFFFDEDFREMIIAAEKLSRCGIDVHMTINFKSKMNKQ